DSVHRINSHKSVDVQMDKSNNSGPRIQLGHRPVAPADDRKKPGIESESADFLYDDYDEDRSEFESEQQYDVDEALHTVYEWLRDGIVPQSEYEIDALSPSYTVCNAS